MPNAKAQDGPSSLRCAARLPWLRELLCHTDGAARAAAARLVGAAAAALSRQQPAAGARAAGELLSSLLAVGCPAAEEGGKRGGGAGAGASSKLEEREGSILAAGFVTAQCRAALPPAALQDAVSRLAALVPSADRQPLLAGAAALALGYLGSAGRLPDLDESTSDASKPSEAAKDGAAGAAGANGSAEEAKADKDEGAAAAAVHESAAVMVIAKALPAPTVGPKEVSQAAATAVARCALAVGLACRGEDRSEVLRAAVKALMGLALSTKSEEALLVAGEALALAFGGVPLSDQQLLRSPGTRLSDLLPAADEDDAAAGGHGNSGSGNGPEAMAVDGGAGSAAGGGAGVAAADALNPRPWLQAEVLSELRGPLAINSKPEARCAAALWLVSLLSYCRCCPLLDEEGTLGQLQGSFSALLGDSNELTQETAARGVSLVYARGGEALRSRLLAQLVGVLQGASPGAAAVSGVKGAALTADTKIFEEGALGSAPGGGGLSTYKELASLASDMGQPELIYKFMDLARHAAAANTSRGAAAGISGIAKLLGGPRAGAKGGPGGAAGALPSLLGPERLAALLPRLYRQQYDPSPK
ncbi:proteasome component ECM29 [Monoraphidium neglectum]|uniref:Proteasome component ECM29 n=1 Tax=Monoraphidium neglectum TaxID=145388 RepID=A0A0D2M354_9CHLO|nr:proteasome component ECM29 [Monoraphidium neglectum]KIY98024.1 proteasome component ECM29 [Monoraphidium neglectum]|eukprot:XP_013897044.1 proteasome component ECM29 [Monoraphidium neglectum]